MIKYFQNTVCVTFDEIVDKSVEENQIGKGIITYFDYRNLIKRDSKGYKAIEAFRSGGNGRKALYAFDRLPTFIQDALKAKYHPKDIYEIAKGSMLERKYQNDIRAFHFFSTTYKYADGSKMSENQIRKYTDKVSLLNAIIAYRNEQKGYRRSLGGSNMAAGFWTEVSESANVVIKKYNLKCRLPKSERSIRRMIAKYEQEDYAGVISGKDRNGNAYKTKESAQDAALRRIMSDYRNLNNEQIAKLYREHVARIEGWPAVSAATVANRRKKWKIYVEAGSRGEKQHNNRHGMQVKRRAPEHPLKLWTVDGWDVELMYQDTKTDKNGHSVTTYTNRLNAVIVLDPCSKYPVGYAIANRESRISIRQAMRNALTHVKELFGQYYFPHQVQSDNYGRGNLTPFYEAMSMYYTPAKVGNAKSKVIEPYFNHLNREYCQFQPNWSGFGVTADKNKQPNADYLNKTIVKHSFPDRDGCIRQIEKMITTMRLRTIDEYRKAWQDCPVEMKLAWSTANFLHHTGETTGYTNQLEGSGVHVTIGGRKRTYDCFDLDFRLKYRTQKWVIKYDPTDLQTVLAESEDGDVQFLLEEKYEQPMALVDREDGDASELKRIFDFDKELKEAVMDVQREDFEALKGLFERNPAIADTLGKFLITDSDGQHKDRKSDARLLNASEAFPGQLRVDNDREAARQQNEEMKRKKRRYIDEKVNVEEFYRGII